MKFLKNLDISLAVSLIIVGMNKFQVSNFKILKVFLIIKHLPAESRI